ncbi:BT1-like protein [Aureococcus anophagefferens]|nr:BT1-like protein [Aureococcus anophagefferens]
MLRENLKAASPLTSDVWYVVKHPAARVAVAALVWLLDLYVYYGDPATYSNGESYGTMIGDIYHGWLLCWLEPDDAPFLALRLAVMVALTFLGVFLGLRTQRHLRDRWKLVLFGYDDGHDEDREPLADQDGALFLVFVITCLTYFFGLKMAQAIHQKQGVGYEAYGAAERPGKIARFSAWFVKRRLLLTRAALVVFWGIGVPMMVADYVHVEKVLSGDTKINESVGKSRFWSAEANDEFARHFVGCCVAALNILIVMQDWDFPDFSGGEIKISALDIESLKFEHCCAWVRRLVPPIYVSGNSSTTAPTRPSPSYDGDAWTRTSPTPHVVLVETGSFTGAYTIDEEDNYVYVARGAWLMWLMCAIPVGAWVVFWWLVFTHEKVHCLNYRDVAHYLDKHRERIANDDDSDGRQEKRRAYVASISAAARAPCCRCRCLRRDEPVHPRARANVLARLDKVNAPVPPLRELIRRPRASLPNFDTRIGNAGRRLDQADRRAREASEEKWYVERATERELKRAGDADPYAPAKAKRSRPLRPLLRVPKKIRSCPPTPTSSRRLLPSLPPGAYPEQTKMADMLTAFVIPAKRSTAPARRASLHPQNITPLRTTFLPAAPLDTSDEPTDDGFWRDSGTWVIVVCYFLQGALGLSRLALNFYLKDELHLSPGDLAALTVSRRRRRARGRGVLRGDGDGRELDRRGARRRERRRLGAVALSDVVVDSLVVEKARDEAEAASLQSVAWSSRYVGAILASLASGAALEALGARGCFGATAFLPLLLCVAALGIDEEPMESKESFWDEGLATLVALKDALLSPAILRPAAFLFLWQATPNCGTAFFYFSTAAVDAGGLGFDPDFLGAPASHANRGWGLDDRVFSLGDDVVQSVLGEVGFLPLLVLAAKICPPGIEGALFAALMSIFNAGGLVSTEVGAVLTDKMGVSESDFSNLAPLVVTCALSSLLPLVFLGWVREAEGGGEDVRPPAR